MVNVPRWQMIAAALVVLAGIVFAAPNLFSRENSVLPSFLAERQLNLGLDLQGGSYVLMGVDVDSVIAEQVTNIVDGIRVSLREARIGYSSLRADGTEARFTLNDSAEADAARGALADILVDSQLSIDDGGNGRIFFTDQALAMRKAQIVSQAIEIVRRRLDETGTREPAVQRQGEDRILIQLPGVDNPQRIIDLLGQTARMTFRLVNETVLPGVDSVPPGTEVLLGEPEVEGGVPPRYAIFKRIMVSGENLTSAQATFEQGQPVVLLTFDGVGAGRFAQATSENVGKRFAIVLDDVVISAPVIRTAITGGRAIISGNFTVESAQDLALVLRAGALPAELTVLEERSIGASLGADSIRAGQIACVLGLLAVLVFMGGAYGLFGIFANIALLMNIVLIFAGLSLLQATLTLPGIAGIVLTIGMAVDANVLIFERIREEQAIGRSPVPAIDAGYRRALGTIIDANLTTLIAAILLFSFGTGPIKGFAVTLSIGLLTSMFSAIMLTRLMVTTWLRRTRPKALGI